MMTVTAVKLQIHHHQPYPNQHSCCCFHCHCLEHQWYLHQLFLMKHWLHPSVVFSILNDHWACFLVHFVDSFLAAFTLYHFQLFHPFFVVLFALSDVNLFLVRMFLLLAFILFFVVVIIIVVFLFLIFRIILLTFFIFFFVVSFLFSQFSLVFSFFSTSLPLVVVGSCNVSIKTKQMPHRKL